MAAAPAPTLLPDAVALWRHRLDAIPAERSPCRYLTPARWAEMRTAALDFLDRFGPEAVRLGWTAPQLFGLHPVHGTARLDQCGALMIAGRRAVGVDADAVRFERTSAYRNGPGQAWGPPVWEVAAMVQHRC